MGKTALLFGGKGVLIVGMGRNFGAAFLSAQSWFDRAAATLDDDLASVCFNGPDAELTKTEYAQPDISPAQGHSTGGAQKASSYQEIDEKRTAEEAAAARAQKQ